MYNEPLTANAVATPTWKGDGGEGVGGGGVGRRLIKKVLIREDYLPEVQPLALKQTDRWAIEGWFGQPKYRTLLRCIGLYFSYNLFRPIFQLVSLRARITITLAL